jgi:hypothetical protein
VEGYIIKVHLKIPKNLLKLIFTPIYPLNLHRQSFHIFSSSLSRESINKLIFYQLNLQCVRLWKKSICIIAYVLKKVKIQQFAFYMIQRFTIQSVTDNFMNIYAVMKFSVPQFAVHFSHTSVLKICQIKQFNSLKIWLNWNRSGNWTQIFSLQSTKSIFDFLLIFRFLPWRKCRMSSSKRKSRTKSSGASRERVYIESFDFISPHGGNKIISQTNKNLLLRGKNYCHFVTAIMWNLRALKAVF